MTTTISPDDYCKDPQAYKNTPGIDNQTKLYWSQYCRLKKKIDSQGMPSQKDLRNALPEAAEGFLLSMLTPEALEFMGILIGAKITYKSIKTVTGKIIKEGLDKETLAIAEKFIAQGGDEAIANGAILADGLFADMVYVDIKIAEEAGYSAGRYAAAYLFDALDGIFSFVDEAFLVLMILSMVFDAWDPCKLDVMLTSELLANFTDSYNAQFRSSLLGNLEATVDSYGHTVINAEWPLEYYAEKSALIPFKNDYYNEIRMNLMLTYLNSLQYNSCGMKMSYQKGGQGKLLTNDIVTGLERSSFIFFSDNNTVVVNWLFKWWPLILALIVVIFAIFFIVRKSK